MSVRYSAGVTTGIKLPLSDLPDHINYESLEFSLEKRFPGFETYWAGNSYGDHDNVEIIIGYKDSTIYVSDINHEQIVRQVDHGWIFDLTEDLQDIATYYGIEYNIGLYFFTAVG